MENLITTCSVSSVFNGDNANYGKKHLIDGSDDTCWQSSTALPHTVTCKLSEAITGEYVLRIQFQGGFVGTHLRVNDKIFNPLNINEMQEFPLSFEQLTDLLKLEILSSSDLYGRVIIYHLQVVVE